ncbi:peptidase, partial [Lacticaseibacillus rhamnosus]
EAALVITLIACISAGGHWFITRLETLPMISHIAIGYGCFSLAANCLGIF